MVNVLYRCFVVIIYFVKFKEFEMVHVRFMNHCFILVLCVN